MMVDEVVFPRRINRDPVRLTPGLVPARTARRGSIVRLEPLDPVRHCAALYRAGHENDSALLSWEYLPWGPFSSEDAFRDQLRSFAAELERVFYAVCDLATGEAIGMATYLDIQPQAGVIEIGGLWFAPAVQGSRTTTEAIFLLLAYAMDDLGYRRMQWRCNARNDRSRKAARRLGFRFEGIWFNHMVVKGRNRDTAWYSIHDTEWPAIRAAIVAWLDPANFDAAGRQRQSLSAATASLTTRFASHS